MIKSNEATIEQMNEAIARFMGATIDVDRNVRFVLPADRMGLAGCGLHACRYHSSWDWLMPVWIKFRHTVPISEHAEKWVAALGYYLISSDDPERFFKRLYYAIQWYNNQTTTNE